MCRLSVLGREGGEAKTATPVERTISIVPSKPDTVEQNKCLGGRLQRTVVLIEPCAARDIAASSDGIGIGDAAPLLVGHNLVDPPSPRAHHANESLP